MKQSIWERSKAHFPANQLWLDLGVGGLLTILLLFGVDCMPRIYHLSPYKTETSYTVNSKTKFTSGRIHVVGKASCPYTLFTIPLCKRQNLASLAFNEMYQQAKIEGLSAQFVNVATTPMWGLTSSTYFLLTIMPFQRM